MVDAPPSCGNLVIALAKRRGRTVKATGGKEVGREQVASETQTSDLKMTTTETIKDNAQKVGAHGRIISHVAVVARLRQRKEKRSARAGNRARVKSWKPRR